MWWHGGQTVKPLAGVSNAYAGYASLQQLVNPVSTLDWGRLKLRAGHFVKVPKPGQEEPGDGVEGSEP